MSSSFPTSNSELLKMKNRCIYPTMKDWHLPDNRTMIHLSLIMLFHSCFGKTAKRTISLKKPAKDSLGLPNSPLYQGQPTIDIPCLPFLKRHASLKSLLSLVCQIKATSRGHTQICPRINIMKMEPPHKVDAQQIFFSFTCKWGVKYWRLSYWHGNNLICLWTSRKPGSVQFLFFFIFSLSLTSEWRWAGLSLQYKPAPVRRGYL